MRHNSPSCLQRNNSGECVKQINVGIIGTGWCGGIRADTCASNPVVGNLHIAETKPERLAEVAKATGWQKSSSTKRV